jgi:broad specificity phosphatase PhoE
MNTCPSWKGVCYGASDAPLAAAPSACFVARLRALAAEQIVSSDLSRCMTLARAIASPATPPLIDIRWRERNFGTWEGRPWEDIHAEDPSAIGKLERPNYAPPSGESLTMMRKRVAAALSALPDSPSLLIVAHGGTIAIAQILLTGQPLSQAAHCIPALGALVTVPR